MDNDDVIREAIRFSEDYGYNRWQEARDKYNELVRELRGEKEAHEADINFYLASSHSKNAKNYDRLAILYDIFKEKGFNQLDIAAEEDRRMQALGYPASNNPDVRAIQEQDGQE
jgi:hypothetical protein